MVLAPCKVLITSCYHTKWEGLKTHHYTVAIIFTSKAYNAIHSFRNKLNHSQVEVQINTPEFLAILVLCLDIPSVMSLER